MLVEELHAHSPLGDGLGKRTPDEGLFVLIEKLADGRRRIERYGDTKHGPTITAGADLHIAVECAAQGFAHYLAPP